MLRMNKNVFKSLLSCLLLCLAMPLFAQAQDADFFRSIGKIYAVVGVLLVSLIGIFAYLFYLERKIARLEKMEEA